jgi:Family of unknown function (DUF6504)
VTAATVGQWQGDVVDVLRGVVDGVDAPAQFLWRGRLWRVCAVEAHWEESAAWWEPSDAGADWGPRRAVYRVEAGCGRHGRRETFDLAFDPDSGRWQLDRVTPR